MRSINERPMMNKIVNINANLHVVEAKLSSKSNGNITVSLDFDREDDSISALFNIRIFKREDGTIGVTCTPIES